jgi:sugar O-acyltransferase (sialic acid O-acetyltransferase NeuD family)
MIIAGAGGHAKEIAGVLMEGRDSCNIFFYDDTGTNINDSLFDKFPILKSAEEAMVRFKEDNRFILGVGKPALRKLLAEKLESIGGRLTSAISSYARIGSLNVKLSDGLNIMTGAIITQEVTIGRGSLINSNATIHHESSIGEFCEISPGAHILGKVSIADLTSVGSGAVILPGVKIGSNVVIGAGAVVTKDVKDGARLAGVPARNI